MENLTPASRKELLDLIEARERTAEHIEVLWQDDDGEWHSTTFVNEAAVIEFEAKGRKRGFATKRA